MSHSVPPVKELLNLTGKVAVVTGASQGIGASIVSRLAEAGANTVVHYRNNKTDAETVLGEIHSAGGQAFSHSSDLSSEDGVAGLIDATISRFGRLDIMVNNAGIFPVKALLDLSHEEWQSMYSANVESAFLCTKLAAKIMRETGDGKPSGGSIINITSITATSPAAAHSHYNSSKAALLMFTRSAAQELGVHGIRVNAVSPGLTNRAGLDEAWPEGVNSWKKQAPLVRLGEPDDIADACLFLASSAARFITGNNLIVDGGMLSATLY